MMIQPATIKRIAAPGMMALLVNLVLIAFVPFLARQDLKPPPPLQLVPFRMAPIAPEPEPETRPKTIKRQSRLEFLVKTEIPKAPAVQTKPPKPLPEIPPLEMEMKVKLETDLRIEPPPERVKFRKIEKKPPPAPVRAPPPEPLRAEAPPEPAAKMETSAVSKASTTGVKSEFQLGEVDTQPRVRRKAPPVYPRSARRRGITGRVVVKCLVTAEGLPTRISIVESEPGGVFDDSVIEAIRKWRFSPGVYQGKAVATWIMAPFRFDLRG